MIGNHRRVRYKHARTSAPYSIATRSKAATMLTKDSLTGRSIKEQIACSISYRTLNTAMVNERKHESIYAGAR